MKFLLLASGLCVAAAQHKTLYHLQAEAEAVCYETTYMDDHFKENGFVLGTCDDTYTVVLAKDDEHVCNGHSEMNTRYCPDSIVTIEILKLGRGSDEVAADATTTTDPPHKPLYYLQAEQEAVCYETTYIDDHFQENGFKPGSCDETYTTVLSKDDETVCNGHSEENVKYCPGETVTIEILKLGRGEDDVAADPPHKPLYYLQAEQEAVCYETTYIDDHFQENGFKPGSCDETYTTVLSKDDETVCNGHSEENVKYCPGETVTIEILKLGRGADEDDAEHKPLYHLESTSRLNPICYETTYIDDHFKENGFTLGVCDESYKNVLSKDDETVCNGHSEENVKYCPGETITIEILKLGK